MTPTQAASTAKWLRKLLRAGAITPYELVLADCLLWSCRAPGRDTARVSLTRLQSLTHQARATIVAGVAKLQRLGVLVRHKHRLLVRWALGAASRQDVNTYAFQPPPTEFTPWPVICGRLSSPARSAPAPATGDAIERALSSLGRAMIVASETSGCKLAGRSNP